jgi:hypothetical protein
MLRLIDAGTVGFSAPLIVLCPPVVMDRFDSVSAGPSTYPSMDPNAVGSYCLTNAFLITEKSRFPLITTPPANVVEPGFVEPQENGTATSRVSTCNRPGAAVASKEVKLTLTYVVELVGAAALATGTNKSLPTSKVLLLVQYVSRGPSRNQ